MRTCWRDVKRRSVEPIGSSVIRNLLISKVNTCTAKRAVH